MIRSLAALPLFALLAASTPALAQQFSADMVTKSASGQAEGQPRKIYVANGKVRMETGGRMGGVVLSDGSAKTAVVLMPEMKSYMDMAQMGRGMQILTPLNPDNPCPQWQELARSMQKDDTAWSCKRVGAETVNGRSTVKYQASSTKGEEGYAWIDPKLKFMVKTQNRNGGGMELQNIKEGPQPASLFEIPAGYQKTDMRQMMQQMQQQRGAQ